jgi:quercetin dioxygenase-like cupin family protein
MISKHTTAIAAIAAGFAALASTPASAGSCPADKVVADAQHERMTTPKGVTDKVVASIDLAREKVGLKDHKFRLRRLVIEPGGVVPWHSHAERPAIIYIVSGTILEYASTCSVPIVHRAGEVATETKATSHWWKNTSGRPVVLLSADILHDQTDPKTM